MVVYPEREKDDGAAKTKTSILPANSVDIVDNINIVINHTSMCVALVTRVNCQA